MKTYNTNPSLKGWSNFNFWVITLAIVAGLALSIVSWWQLCLESCTAIKNYRLFGLSFGPIGVAFFAGLLGTTLLSRWAPFLIQWVKWAIAGALGAEVMFIAVQKYQIGSWCPVCISIAISLGIAGLVLVVDYIRKLFATIQTSNRGEIMRLINRGVASIAFFLTGFLMAFTGVQKVDAAQAAATEMKQRLVFGNKESPVEVYFITDWYCPSCKRVEPIIEKVYPDIKSKVAFYFIDYPIHTKSLNFSPYNLSFLIYNKPQYFQARHALQDLTEKTESPSDKEVAELAKKVNIKFKELSYVDIKAGLEFFEKVEEDFKVNSTPTLIISNPKKKKVVKLEGATAISQDKILEAIKSVQS